MKIIIIFILSLFFIQSSTFGKDENFLSFSEMTIDQCPGEAGSWIELYNSNNTSLAFEKFSIVCNNKVIFSTENIKKHPAFFPAYCFVIIKYVKEVEHDIFPDFRENIITYYVKEKDKIKLDATPIFRKNIESQWIKNRSPGYCALFKESKQTKENLYDYVCWGRGIFLAKYPDIFKNKISLWANEKGIWNNSEYLEGVYVGISPAPGDQYIFTEKAGIARINFKNHLRDSWQVIGDFPIDYNKRTLFSPRKANLLYPLIITLPRNGANIDKNEIEHFAVQIDPRLLILHNKLEIRYQISKDPYFQKIIFDKKADSAPIIPKKLLQSARYYARVKIEMKEYQTNWSSTITFTYDLQKNNAD